jgi:hypothetical protein
MVTYFQLSSFSSSAKIEQGACERSVRAPCQLGKTLLTMTMTKPLFVPQILAQAGPGPIIDWVGHFAALVG